MRKISVICVCLLFIVSALTASAIVSAPKPDKPPKPPQGPEPTGTIFFEYWDSSDTSVWSMNADGSDKTKQTLVDCNVARLSREKHNDHYWYIGFCEIVGENYPDGIPRHEIFAISDDRTMIAQLTDDPYLEPRHYEGVPEDPFWGINDVTVTWGALRWVCNPDCVIDEDQAGYYDATIIYDSSGNIVDAGEPSLIWWTELKLDSWGYYVPRTGSCNHWAPDGTKIVRYKWGINVLDLVSGTEAVIASGHHPKWSPDGSKIAFQAGDEHSIRIINPDGSDEEIVIEVKDSKSTWNNVVAPRWSHDSNFLIYLNHKTQHRTYPNTHKYDIYRVSIDGSGNTCLTQDLSAEFNKRTMGWR